MPADDTLSVRASESKKRVGRSVSINGVSAIGVDLKRAANLNDPILDVNVKVNNPVGRLWLALKRLWKSQNTVVALRFTIPLIVLPIALYVLWSVWQGRGASVAVSKLGLVHPVVVSGKQQDILILPTSDVYLLDYTSSQAESQVIREKPVIVLGVYRRLENIIYVDGLIPYHASDLVPGADVPVKERSMWDTLLRFIGQFR